MVGIYKITSPTGRVYIGQSWGIEGRLKYYQRGANKKQCKIYASLKKYGWQAHKFEICHELPKDTTQEVLDNYEILYHDLYKSCGIDMMNIREPGNGGRNSEETRKKMSENNWNKKHPGKLSSSYGNKLTPEQRARYEENRPRGASHPYFGLYGKNHPHYGFKQSEEWRLSRCTKIINTETLEEYESVRQAAKVFEIDETSLCKFLKGKLSWKTKPNPPLQYLSEYNKQNNTQEL